ncbi:hypothetical protein BABINDRAFT_159872 [Babjeviella inositovora NRRL Y-12698]|uniref:Pre-mRNA-splicing factor n=1 Tax=Babjeviella inositovora NRRL Y-12698 TaxID=984486 RepID=A0A1E3QVB6_9ASCO|nr:uncharacterized protein BABINDRAFT_159872 [Babjeviella inositovora NRRL Y-12698]ODQ81600.1 hypothetical protein BABINDRAFT_159872 [Babjeviella inositovora NRRL Y-12698]
MAGFGFSIKKNEKVLDPPKKVSIGFGFKKAPTAKKPLAKPSLFHNPNDDEEEEGKIQKIDTFDSRKGGAFHKDNVPKIVSPLIIKPVPNRDWRAEALARKEQSVDEPQERMIYGLNQFTTETNISKDAPETDEVINTPLTAEEQARAELLANPSTMSTSEKLTIPLEGFDEDLYKRDIVKRPGATTQDEYEAVPVEDFGAALLRGMGWKGNKTKKASLQNGSSAVKKRPAWLGIGAQPLDEEMAKGQVRGMERVYNPIVMRDITTGEIMELSPAGGKRVYENEGNGVGVKRRNDRD